MIVVGNIGAASVFVRNVNERIAPGSDTRRTELQPGIESGLKKAGEPVRGGKIVYGLEAETSGGLCLSESQLAISGIQVARTIYETLTMPNDKGQYVPYLAKSIDHNSTYDAWTVELRSGVQFHDGSELTAKVVKNNFDAYRNNYPGRSAPLFGLIFEDITAIKVVDDLTVMFTTARPWVAFPAFLYSSGRTGIMAQAQLDDTEQCNRNLIGTGPFELKEWAMGQRLVVTAFRGYWRQAPDGKPYPYLSEIEYRPSPLNTLHAGDIDALNTSSTSGILSLRHEASAGEANLLEADELDGVTYLMPQTARAPLDDMRIRRALQLGIDNRAINETVTTKLPTLANGPFAPGTVGSLDDNGWPKPDVVAAKALVDDYRMDHGDALVRLTLLVGPGDEAAEIGISVQAQAAEIDITIDLYLVEESKLLNDAIGGAYDLMIFSDELSGDPDTQYVRWKSDSFANFGRINDPEIDRLLDTGRSQTDPVKRKKDFENLNRRFADQAWNLWVWYTPRAVGMASSVHGVYGPDLPDGSKPFRGLAAGHSVLGMWVDQN